MPSQNAMPEPARPLGIIAQPYLVPELPLLFEVDEIAERVRLTPDAQRFGLMVVVPRPVSELVLVLAAGSWSRALCVLGVPKVAVVLGVDSWLESQRCHAEMARRLRSASVALAVMHEGHLGTDEIIAWFEDRPPTHVFGFAELEELRVKLRDRGDAWAVAHVEALADYLRDNVTTASLRGARPAERREP